MKMKRLANSPYGRFTRQVGAGVLAGLLLVVLSILAGAALQDLLLSEASAAVLTPYEDGDASYTILANGSIQLGANPTNGRAVKLWRNGLRQKFGADYNVFQGLPRVIVPVGWKASTADVFVIDYWHY